MTEKMVEPAHLQLALGLSPRAVAAQILKQKIPAYDRISRPMGKPRQGWNLATIRAWRPDVGDFIAPLLKLHPVGARKAA